MDEHQKGDNEITIIPPQNFLSTVLSVLTLFFLSYVINYLVFYINVRKGTLEHKQYSQDVAGC